MKREVTGTATAKRLGNTGLQLGGFGIKSSTSGEIPKF
jgi:hypothetical protein